jgi:hypothetical protein
MCCTTAQVYVYVGEKRPNPRGELHPIDAAGLMNGKLYAIKVDGFSVESYTAMPSFGTNPVR